MGEQQRDPAQLPSINEPPFGDPPPGAEAARPPGSPELPAGDPPTDEPPPQPELPSDEELMKLTRRELDDLAEERGLDSTDLPTKADVVELLKGGYEDDDDPDEPQGE